MTTRSTPSQKATAAAARVLAILFFALAVPSIIIGWFTNLYALLTTASDLTLPIMILRIAGVFLVPLGTLLGYAL